MFVSQDLSLFKDYSDSFVWILAPACRAVSIRKRRMDMRCAVCLVVSVLHSRDVMRKQLSLMYMCVRVCVCVCSITAELRVCHPQYLWQLFLSPSSLPLCLYFAFLQTDSKNRSLVTQRIGDGRSERGENSPAVFIAATHAVIRPTYAVWVECLSLHLSQITWSTCA